MAWKKIFSNQSKTITGAAVILGAASFFSRIIGIIRDRVLAHYFGAGDALDVYYAAFRIPDFIYNLLIIGALSAGFIPVFTRVLTKDKDEAWKVANSMLNILGFCLIVLCGLIYFFAPILVPLVTPGFSEEKLNNTVTLTRIMLLSPFFLGLSTVISGVLQSFKNFLITSLAPIIYNLSIILGAVILVPFFGAKGLAYGVVLGAFLHLAVQIPSIYYHGYKYQKILNLKDKNVQTISKLIIPRTMGLAVTQLNWIVLISIASTLTAGSVTVFHLADNLQYAPVGIIGVSFAMAAFPILGLFAAEGKKEAIIDHLVSTIKQIFFLVVPISIAFIMLRAQIVRIVYGSGKFDWEATIMTMNTLAIFSFSLFAQCIMPLLARTLFTLNDTWSPFIFSLISTVVNIFLGYTLKDTYGLTGLAFSFSIASIINAVLLWLALRQKLGTLKELSILKSLFKISLAGIFMAFLIQIAKYPLANIVDMQRFWGVLIQAFVSGTIGVLAYLTICWLLKLDEIQHIKKSLTRKWLRVRRTQTDIDSKIS